MVKRLALIMLLLGAFRLISAEVQNERKSAKPFLPKSDLQLSEPVYIEPTPEIPTEPIDTFWVQVGTAIHPDPHPFARHRDYSAWEYIYLQSEINYSGNIIALQFYTHSTGDGSPIENVSIYMKDTTADIYLDGNYSLEGYTLVYSGTFPNSDTGWNTVSLSTPFQYSNTKNLSILILRDYQERILCCPTFRTTSTVPNYRGRLNGTDGSPSTYLSTFLYRANIRLGFAVPVNDVGVTSLIAPIGTLDSGTVVTPACSVYNYGTTTATYLVRLKLGSPAFYTATASVSFHNPGTSVYLTFPPTTANWPRGNHPVSCSTELSGDINPGNDKATNSVFVRVLDATTTSILSPSGTVNQGETYPVQAIVRNNGNTTVSFDVKFDIQDGYTDTKTVIDLGPNAEDTVDFNNWIPNTPGSFATKCSTRLTNDMNPNNDWLTGSVFVQRLDAQCLSIDEPTGTVNYGAVIQPKATIRNNGNTEKTFDVTFWIEGTKYEDTRSVTLGPGGEEQIIFADWTAQPIGNLGIRCTTKLDGDMDNENDRQEASVFVQFLDVAPIEIVAPRDTIDSGAVITPKARVKNNGNANVSFPFTFSIGDWSSTKDLHLSPNEEILIEFDPWRAEIIGPSATKCTTQLEGDMSPENDKLEGEVFVKGGGIPPVVGWTKVADVPIEPDRKRIKSGGGMAKCGEKLFILKGNNTRSLYRYTPNAPVAEYEDSIPLGASNKKVKKGSGIISDGRYLYIFKGANTKEFFRYDPRRGETTWKELPPVQGEKGLKGGTGLAYLPGYIYLLKGSKTNEFYRFNLSNETWETPTQPVTEKGFKDGSCLVAYNDTLIYALQGYYNNFYLYSPNKDSWRTKTALPLYHPQLNRKKKVKEGAVMTVKGGEIFAFKGGNTGEFWMYKPEKDSWYGKDTIPRGEDRKRVKGGSALVTFGNEIWALKGNNTTSIWRYSEGDILMVSVLPNEGLLGEGKRIKETGLKISSVTKTPLHLSSNLPRGTLSTLSLYNSLGKLVYQEKSDKGIFSIRELPAGIYLLRFEAKGYKEERKLIIIR